MISPWFMLAVLSLATFVLTHLVVYLDFPPVLWLRDRVVGGWRPLTPKEDDQLRRSIAGQAPKVGWDWSDIEGITNRHSPRSDRVPYFFTGLMSCPWCVGAWIAAALTVGTDLWVGLPVPFLMWAAVWALGSLLSSRDWV